MHFAWSRTEEDAHVIGTPVKDTMKCGPYQMKLPNSSNRITIGVDMTLCKWNELCTRRISPEIELRGGLSRYRITSDVMPWGEPMAVSNEDVVIKMGRSTGLTRGYPRNITALVVSSPPGDYELRPGATPTTFHAVRRNRKQVRVELLNQYMIAHHRGEERPVFALDGDSGSLCYFNSSEWSDDDKFKLKPWALLNGGFWSTLAAYGIASPLDAVIKSLGAGVNEKLTFISPENVYRLGNFRYDE